ncbi:MAG: SRPBCC family protein [Flavobacteriales bacterium]|nr:SRPBCC family protein [Flavobacteriales bacterium]
MKILGRTLKLIVALALVVFLAGFLYGWQAGPVSFESEVQVDAPQGYSWSVFQDPSHMRTWLSGFQRIEMVDGQIGQPGSSYDIIAVDHGEEIVIRQTIISIRPPEQFTYSMSNEFIEGSTEILVTTEGQKSKFSVKTTFEGTSPIKNLLVHLSSSHLATDDQANWDRLKHLIEARYARE